MIETQLRGVRLRRSREEADRLVMEYEQSGLTRRSFCHQHGLSVATLDNYRKRRACGPGRAPDGTAATTGTSTVTFLPVELVERSSLSREVIDNGASLYIELVGGRRIGVTAGFDAVTLTRLIAVLEQA
jgi:hypothetical protein